MSDRLDETHNEGEGVPICDSEDMLSVGSYLTDALLPESEVRVKILAALSDSRAALDISGVKLNLEESIDELCSILMDQTSALNKNSFSFLFCDLGDANLQRLMNGLSLQDCISLNLSWNKLSYKAMHYLGPLMSSPDICTIRSLELDGNSIGPIGCQILLSNLRQGLTIDKLNVQGNGIGDLGVLYICESMLSRGLRILDLNIEGNGITDRGIQNLCRELAGEMACVQALNVSNNEVGPGGVRCLGAMLGSNKSIIKLDIHHIAVGDTCIGDIADGLKTNSTLKEINLSDNDISSEGAKILFGALAENSGLETLKLARSVNRLSSIGVLGGHAVGEMLKINKSLTNLDLYHGLVGATGAESIATGLKENTTLKVINLGGNYIGPEATKSILNSLDASQTKNFKYFKIRGPLEPMKFFRKNAPLWKLKKSRSRSAADVDCLVKTTTMLPDTAVSDAAPEGIVGIGAPLQPDDPIVSIVDASSPPL